MLEPRRAQAPQGQGHGPGRHQGQGHDAAQGQAATRSRREARRTAILLAPRSTTWTLPHAPRASAGINTPTGPFSMVAVPMAAPATTAPGFHPSMKRQAPHATSNTSKVRGTSIMPTRPYCSIPKDESTMKAAPSPARHEKRRAPRNAVPTTVAMEQSATGRRAASSTGPSIPMQPIISQYRRGGFSKARCPSHQGTTMSPRREHLASHAEVEILVVLVQAQRLPQVHQEDCQRGQDQQEQAPALGRGQGGNQRSPCSTRRWAARTWRFLYAAWLVSPMLVFR